jgi:hypothetical protein
MTDPFSAENRKPAERYRFSGPKLLKSAFYYLSNLMYTPPPTRCARDDDGGDGRETASRKEYCSKVRQVNKFQMENSTLFSIRFIEILHSSDPLYSRLA